MPGGEVGTGVGVSPGTGVTVGSTWSRQYASRSERGSGVGVADGIAVGLTAGSGVVVGVGVGRTGVGDGVTVGTRVALTKTVRGVGDGMGSGVDCSGVGVQARVVRANVIEVARTKLGESIRHRWSIGLIFIEGTGFGDGFSSTLPSDSPRFVARPALNREPLIRDSHQIYSDHMIYSR